MPKKKVVKKKNPRTANKQRQAVNVKIKIDQSRRTNPREPRQAVKGSSLPSRAYTANSSTPLHTTIMTATPSPAILQKEPNYSEVVGNMFKEAEKRQNNQLQLISQGLAQRERELLHLLDENAKNATPPTAELYDALMKEHGSRVPQPFQDPNAKATSRLRTPVRFPPPEENEEENAEGLAESKEPEQPKQTATEFTPVAKRTRSRAPAQPPIIIIKRPVGRPRKVPIPIPIAQPVTEPPIQQEEPPVVPVEKTPKITKYFKTKKEAEADEAESQRQEIEAAAAAILTTPTPKKKRNRKKSEKKNKLQLVE